MMIRQWTINNLCTSPILINKLTPYRLRVLAKKLDNGSLYQPIKIYLKVPKIIKLSNRITLKLWLPVKFKVQCPLPPL